MMIMVVIWMMDNTRKRKDLAGCVTAEDLQLVALALSKSLIER